MTDPVKPSPSEMSKPECRVLQVFSMLGIGGAETWLIALLKYFEQVRIELPVRLRIDICLTGGSKAHFDEEASSLGAKLFYPHFCRKNLPFFIREFRRILANGRYHVIHDHQDYTAGLHFLFGFGHLPPVRIAHIHNPLTYIKSYSSSPLRRFTISTGKQLLAYLATHIMGTSRQIVAEYGFDDPTFRKVIRGAAYCGFDVTRFQGDQFKLHNELCNEFGLDNQSKILLFVGRLDSNKDPKLNQKNPEFALEIVKICILREPSVFLLMAGSGEEMRIQLESRVKDWGLQDKIRLIGPRADIPRLMVGSDLLLLPSLAEGLGMVVVEAQAAGLPVLASDTTPKECEIVAGLVRFLSLRADKGKWVEEIFNILASPKPNPQSCNQAVRESPFSIDKSASRLIQLYRGVHSP